MQFYFVSTQFIFLDNIFDWLFTFIFQVYLLSKRFLLIRAMFTLFCLRNSYTTMHKLIELDRLIFLKRRENRALSSLILIIQKLYFFIRRR